MVLEGSVQDQAGQWLWASGERPASNDRNAWESKLFVSLARRGEQEVDRSQSCWGCHFCYTSLPKDPQHLSKRLFWRIHF